MPTANNMPHWLPGLSGAARNSIAAQLNSNGPTADTGHAVYRDERTCSFALHEQATFADLAAQLADRGRGRRGLPLYVRITFGKRRSV